MKRVLFIDDDEDMRRLHIPIIENLINEIEVVEAVSGNQAVLLLAENSSFDLIVCDYEMEDGNGDVVFKYLNNKKLKTSFILYTTKNMEDINGIENLTGENKKYLKKIAPKNIFKETILKLINSSEEEKEYSKIRCSYLWRYNRSLVDLYVKISSSKFVKVIRANDLYTKEDIDKYISKKQKFIYVKSASLNEFLDRGQELPFLILDASVKKDENIIRTTHAIIHEMALSLGLTKESIKLADSIVNEIEEMIKNDEEIYRYYLKARDSKDYLYDHSYLVSILCCEIAKKMKWNNRDTAKKLCLASIFHDITLESSKLAMMQNPSLEELSRLSSREKQSFFDHPFKAASLVRTTDKLPADIDSIILCHHELPLGGGFPRKLSADRIYPLARIFIVSHDFVSRLYACDFDESHFANILSPIFKTRFS